MKIIQAMRAPGLARQNWGSGLGGGNHSSGVRFAQSRSRLPDQTPNPNPGSLQVPDPNPTLSRTLTLNPDRKNTNETNVNIKTMKSA